MREYLNRMLPAPERGEACRLRGVEVKMQDRIRYHILKQVQANPKVTQRELAQSLGLSLGKVHYCLRALIEKGLVKADNFSKSRNKPGSPIKRPPRMELFL